VASITNGEKHGFLYTGGVLHDLNALLDSASAGWKVTIATSANDAGRIAGNAIEPAGHFRLQ
jgi:hypothetical protein